LEPIWSQEDYGGDLDQEPWNNVGDMLPSAFRGKISSDSPATSRAALLSRETPFGNVGVGKLYVGDSTSAVQWAGFHVAYIINCADINYAWHPWCPRFWLNVGFRGLQEELNWSERMMAAVKLVMLALMFGQGVLLHCRQGKHRSSAFCVLMLALLWGCSVQTALDRYWSRRPDLRPHDWSILDKILLRKNNFNALVESVRQQSWFPKARGNILNRLWAFRVQPPTPKPKKMPRLTSAPGERGTSRQTSPPRDQRSASTYLPTYNYYYDHRHHHPHHRHHHHHHHDHHHHHHHRAARPSPSAAAQLLRWRRAGGPVGAGWLGRGGAAGRALFNY